jgi:hypothetical protein
VWHRENLSKYKWLRGGIEVVEQVRWLKCIGVLLGEADACWRIGCRYQSRRLVRCCEIIMRSKLTTGRSCRVFHLCRRSDQYVMWQLMLLYGYQATLQNNDILLGPQAQCRPKSTCGLEFQAAHFSSINYSSDILR